MAEIHGRNPNLRQLRDEASSKGIIAAGAATASALRLPVSLDDVAGQPAAPGTVERLITLNVNGQERRVDVMPQDTLAMTLRYKLGLTGTKLGCDRAGVRRVHGADRRCAALLVFGARAHACAGKKIVTIEGLADPPTASCSRCSRASSTSRASSARSACRASSMAAAGYLEDESESDARRNWRTASPATCAAARTTTRFSPR